MERAACDMAIICQVYIVALQNIIEAKVQRFPMFWENPEGTEAYYGNEVRKRNEGQQLTREGQGSSFHYTKSFTDCCQKLQCTEYIQPSSKMRI